MARFAADEGTDDTGQIKFHRAANKGNAILPRLEWCFLPGSRIFMLYLKRLISLFLLIWSNLWFSACWFLLPLRQLAFLLPSAIFFLKTWCKSWADFQNSKASFSVSRFNAGCCLCFSRKINFLRLFCIWSSKAFYRYVSPTYHD